MPAPIEIPTRSLVIGVPVRNQLEITRRCLAALLRYRPAGSQIVIVDDASEAECSAHLEEFATSAPGVELVRNRRQRGFPHACNQIIAQTSKEVICLLNSDAMVSPGWAEYILQVMSLDDSFGLAGPSTSFTHTPQSLPGLLDFRKVMDEDMVREMAELVFLSYRGQCEPLPTLGGFCLFLKREVVRAIGGFDERFGLGCGEEDDFIARARQEMFQAIWVKYSYVHHVGHCSFSEEMGTASAQLWAKNRLIYEIKRLRPNIGHIAQAAH